MKFNAVRLFALVNVLIVGYLFYELYQLKHPRREVPPETQSSINPPEVDVGNAFARAINPEISPQQRLAALRSLQLTQLNRDEADQIAENLFSQQPHSTILTTLELRSQAGRLLLNSPVNHSKLISLLAAIAQDQEQPLPLRNQSLILTYQLISQTDRMTDENLALYAQTKEELFKDRSTSLAATVIEGEAYLYERRPEFAKREALTKLVLRGLRDLRSAESVQLAALMVATNVKITEAREDAKAIATANPSQSLTLAAVNAAAALGAPKSFFENLSYNDSKLELARLQALGNKQ
ncbi:hypothetical protein [Cerasicoccus frondis]|uniref:hypothetical protein n=1 Tax=Cerasicoccus frondis TaxID=490090 RepID=UPI0028528BA2|nr:hypothetical protein [Cerasicoccus frondis]